MHYTVDDTDDMINDMTLCVDSIQAENSDLTYDLQDARAEHEMLNATITHLNAMLRDSDLRAAQLRQDNEALRQALQAAVSSAQTTLHTPEDTYDVRMVEWRWALAAQVLVSIRSVDVLADSIVDKFSTDIRCALADMRS